MPASASAMLRNWIALICLIVPSATALARIGETTLQFVDRYSAPKDTRASHKSMHPQNWAKASY